VLDQLGGGGGIFCFCDSNLIITNNLIANNYSLERGGGLLIHDCSPLISGNTVSGNLAGELGGGFYLKNRSSYIPNISNCIIWGNSDSSGFGNTSQIYYDSWGPTVTSSCVQGGWPGMDNIDQNPFFVDATGLDDDPNTWEDNDYRLLPGSPCIDVGDSNSVPADTIDMDNDGDTAEPVPFDLDGRPRIVDGDCNNTATVDMGAYEFDYRYFGDFDGQCNVDLADFAILALYWLQNEPLVDIAPSPTGDGIVDMRELAILCDYWLGGTGGL